MDMTLDQIITQARSESLKIHRLDNHSGLQVLKLETPKASLVLHLQGAHVSSFIPRGADDILWLSSLAEFAPGKAIRGGIPLCWPWFGKHPKQAELAQHGFARNSLFKLIDIRTIEQDNALVTLELTDTAQTRTIFPFAFKLTVELLISTSLTIKLITTNLSRLPLPLSQAIHTYFNLQDIYNTQLTGLEAAPFYDQLSGKDDNETSSVITFKKETDRIYRTCNAQLVIDDSARQITIQQSGDDSTVVWNPWVEKSLRMSDFPDDGYVEMLCVEAANTVDKLLLQPGDSYELSQTIGLEE